jgi:hypothetical protein
LSEGVVVEAGGDSLFFVSLELSPLVDFELESDESDDDDFFA